MVSSKCKKCENGDKAIDPNMDNYWIVMNYHPAIYSYLKMAVAELNQNTSLQQLYSFAYDGRKYCLKLSWKNATSHIQFTLRK